MSDEIKVGSEIWHFNPSRRVYAAKKPGERYTSGGPIYREHWHKVEVTGETRVSWVTAYGKCPKRGYSKPWALRDVEVDMDVYIAEHKHRIAHAVEQLTFGGSYDTFTVYVKLKEIATIVGYAP